MSQKLQISESDLFHHVIKFGVDVYPPVDISESRVKLNLFYEETHSRWPELFASLSTSDTRFEISGTYSAKSGKGVKAQAPTFVLTPRGPVMFFPLLLPPPIGDTGVANIFIERFREVSDMFCALLGNLQRMKVGLVRELVFQTGKQSPLPMITPVKYLAGASLAAASNRFTFHDDMCAVILKMDHVEVHKSQPGPAGQQMVVNMGHGLQVELDVNNRVLKPLTDGEVTLILERASGLWPKALVQFLNSNMEHGS